MLGLGSVSVLKVHSRNKAFGRREVLPLCHAAVGSAHKYFSALHALPVAQNSGVDFLRLRSRFGFRVWSLGFRAYGLGFRV